MIGGDTLARARQWIAEQAAPVEPEPLVSAAGIVAMAAEFIAPEERLHRVGDDGFVYPYRDANRGPDGDLPGFPTIGYGHLLTRRRDVALERFGRITKHQAYRLLLLDVSDSLSDVTRLVKVPLTPGQAVALTSFVFNLGAGPEVRGSRLLARLNRGDYERAAEEFPRWRYSGGRVLRGLVRRRAREQDLFLT